MVGYHDDKEIVPVVKVLLLWGGKKKQHCMSQDDDTRPPFQLQPPQSQKRSGCTTAKPSCFRHFRPRYSNIQWCSDSLHHKFCSLLCQCLLFFILVLSCLQPRLADALLTWQHQWKERIHFLIISAKVPGSTHQAHNMCPFLNASLTVKDMALPGTSYLPSPSKEGSQLCLIPVK